MVLTDQARPSTEATPRAGGGVKRAAALVLPAWVLTLGVDLFLHAGVMADFYMRETSFLVDPATAFRRIPAGYLSFLLLTTALYWLLVRSGIRGAGAGFRWGTMAGLTVWGSLLLAVWSITTAPVDLLLGWWVGQGLELGLAGAVLGAGLGGVSLRRTWGWVGVGVLVMGVVVVALQTMGLAPAVKVS